MPFFKAKVEELKHQPKAEFSLKAFRECLRWHNSFTQRLYFYPHVAYTNRYPEIEPLLDWSSTRKVNGKIVSDLRKKVRKCLILEGGEEYEGAVAAKEKINKYWQHKQREYEKFRIRNRIAG
ncbi:hypothetical protein [Calothrix sp. PCC 6303]|uniref:hypothetical protein n=1 Tax=Calothrix sp. PCC 6303 TaxID=1170562 RepID=UPI0002A03AA3|nr:hypothetical protein [Calothrix sp. PCC 6303]AFY99545.1 hypothetical protein Cal6303_0468 [Calothrix sp. PCC 6303]